MENESNSTEAIRLTRNLFEFIHGNLGLLKFSVEELKPTNGTNGENSMKWHIVCSFFETLGSTAPSRYNVDVNLNDKTVTIEKITAPGTQQNEPKQQFKVVSKDEEKGSEKPEAQK